MKKLFKSVCLLAIVSSLITSCSIEKRHFLPGYHVEWKHKNKVENTLVKEENTPQTTISDNQVKPPAVATDQTENAANLPIENAEIIKPKQEELKQDLVVNKDQASTFSEENNIESTKEENIISASNIQVSMLAPAKKPNQPMASQVLLIIMCFIPILSIIAVGLVTDWGMPTVWNLLWYLTFIGWIIHGIIVVMREG